MKGKLKKIRDMIDNVAVIGLTVGMITMLAYWIVGYTGPVMSVAVVTMGISYCWVALRFAFDDKGRR